MSKTLRMLLGLMVVSAPLAFVGCDEEKKAEVKPAAAAATTPTDAKHATDVKPVVVAPADAKPAK